MGRAAVSATDGDVVLKVGWTHDEARDEAAGLRAWGGRGAVRLLDAVVEGETSALLLERAVPGTPLSSRDGPEQDVVLAGLLRRLWVDPGGHPFRPLYEMCDAWIEQTRPELGHLDTGLVRDGLELFAGLTRDETPQVLLATDLHAENVLAAQREPWLVIDPKPYVGDPAYDVLQAHAQRPWSAPGGPAWVRALFDAATAAFVRASAVASVVAVVALAGVAATVVVGLRRR